MFQLLWSALSRLSDNVPIFVKVAVAMQKADVGIPEEDIMYLLEEADLNQDGIISFSEFRGLIFGLWKIAVASNHDL